ncbi:MAG: sensor domain-containing diguanylate cyclase [Deltaproteobacteria bacterium]|nr:sensor domain-containing diguanylate cyclase [Deltaproteobacteria bacterium]
MSSGIVTLGPDEIGRFLLRFRRNDTLERYEPRLDHFLREILAKANEFVPSEAGAILLDDPRAKLFGKGGRTLTFIAAFGAHAQQLLGEKLPVDRGIVGRVYSTGAPSCCRVGEEERSLYEQLDERTGSTTQSLLAVPVVVGSAICGVLQLINRSGRDSFTTEDRTLIEVFAGYISSSMQNTLDALRAREVARRDNLTGLYNDRYFHYRLREEIRRADADSSSLSLIFIDLDRFKEVNDTRGHLAGSRTLHEVGLLLQSEAPSEAVAARYGGDEFVLILPGLDGSGAREVAERMRRKVELTSFLAESEIQLEASSVTASIGVASFAEHVRRAGDHVQRANALIRLADGAMYQAKAAGKNRVVVASREEEP